MNLKRYLVMLACFSVLLCMHLAMADGKEIRTAILAGGCFWCTESDFDKLDGVVSTLPGYTGGTISSPTYENYHNTDHGNIPHVEAVEIKYDPAVVSYETLIDYYFRHIDPADGGGQFCDRGPAYRPVIFVNGSEENKVAEKIKEDVGKKIKTNVAVEILPAEKFWPAEDYHRKYYQKNPNRYAFYRWNCGRDQRVQEVWGSSSH